MLEFQYNERHNRPFAPESLGRAINRFFPQAQTSYATWPVWSDSTEQPVEFTPLPRKRAVRLYHQARAFERQTRHPGQQDGTLGRNGLKVLEALIFDFLNFATGQLWPSIESLAAKAGISPSSARRGLDKLKAAGVLFWQRRKDCVAVGAQTLWFQLSNAYHIKTADQWSGYTPPHEPPPPHPSTWGATPPLPSGLERACDLMRERRSVTPPLLAMLEEDSRDTLATALARLGRAMAVRSNKPGFSGLSA